MYDVIVIGSGPGGYIAAERAGAHGQKVLLVEKDQLGGVCLNTGCVPAKTLLQSAKIYSLAQKSNNYGVQIQDVSYDMKVILKRKEDIIATLQKGVAYQMKKYGVETLFGTAHFVSPKEIKVDDKVIRGKNFIIATGSSPGKPPVPGIDSDTVITNVEAFNLETLPDHLVIIGAGVVGIEFASFYTAMGKKVSVIEMEDEILPFAEPSLAKELRKTMKDVRFYLSARVEKIDKNKVFFTLNNEEKEIAGDLILAATGRYANVENIGLEETGLDFTKQGIKINDAMQTNLPNIYAIGDVTGKSTLAHSASRMAEVAVNNLFSDPDIMRYHAVPWVVYSNPEMASCGITEQQAKTKGIDIITQTVPLRINARFLIENKGINGYCKVILDKKTRCLLGVHLLGGMCSEMIYGVSAMIEDEFRVKDIKQVIFPHPTVSEVIKDTLWEIEG